MVISISFICRFFGGLFGGTPHCGSCCYNSQPFNNNGFNSNFQNQGGFNNQGGSNSQGFNQNQGFNNQNNRGCQCDYSLTFRDHLPAQRQHREDVVLHHRLEQQLWRPADLEEVSKQPLVLHGLQQPRTMRNVNSAII